VMVSRHAHPPMTRTSNQDEQVEPRRRTMAWRSTLATPTAPESFQAGGRTCRSRPQPGLEHGCCMSCMFLIPHTERPVIGVSACLTVDSLASCRALCCVVSAMSFVYVWLYVLSSTGASMCVGCIVLPEPPSRGWPRQHRAGHPFPSHKDESHHGLSVSRCPSPGGGWLAQEAEFENNGHPTSIPCLSQKRHVSMAHER
jgi:hypothetical protein